MFRLFTSVGILIVVVLWSSPRTFAQVSTQADKRVKDAETAQAKSWEQVDQINKQTDQTRARLNQSRQSANPPAQQGGYTVKKREVGTFSPYIKKQKPLKKTESPKGK